MCLKKLIALTLALLLLSGTALAHGFDPLPMDSTASGPAPKKENYLSDDEYVDESISVKIDYGRYADTDYVYAHVKIVDPSQLRTAPADAYYTRNAHFRKTGGLTTGYRVASKVNAVVAINGDYFTQNACTIVLRMGKQYYTSDDSLRDLLIIDYNGDFSYIRTPGLDASGNIKPILKADYTAYYEAHKAEMYQVLCFGPVMVEDGKSLISEEYYNGYIGSSKGTQRAAICQLGPLEYFIVTCNSNQVSGNKGMTIYEFAQLCEQIGWELNPESGCRLAYNLDGGNSSTISFQRQNKKTGYWEYVKVNCPQIERPLADIIYFATLVK